LQDFLFQVVLLGFIGFLGIVYLHFVGAWIWVFIFFISSESCINLFWGREWFPSLLHLPIIPLGAVSFPGLWVIQHLLTYNTKTKPRKKKKEKGKERKKKWRTKEIKGRDGGQ
jgi:hypothetical protein